MTTFVKIPQHGSSILSTRGTQRSIRRDSNGVDVTSVSDVVGLKAARGEFPDLNELIPAGADDNWVLWVRAESNARNPVGVSLLVDGKLAVSESVPQLDGSVAGSGDNLSVVGRERDGENVVVVSNKSAGGGTSGKLPKAESLVPGSRESVGTIRGDDTVGNNMRVTVKRSFGVAVGTLVAGQVPDD